MSIALQYRINDRTEDYIFMSPWVDQDTPDILAKDFQRPLKMLRKGVKHYDGDDTPVAERSQVIGSIPMSLRENFGRLVPPKHDGEGDDIGNTYTFNVKNSLIKPSGFDKMAIETRLIQFVPFLALAAAAYQKKSPDLYTESMMYLNVKQWDINQWSEGPEGILHADPIQNNRLRYAMQDSMLVCDCAPTEFEGVDFNAYDIIAFDAQANHRQPAIYGGRINDGRRTMAHLAFVHEI